MVASLERLRTQLGAEGELDAAIDEACAERRAHGGADSLEACHAQAARCLCVLDCGRKRWPMWESSAKGLLYERLGALSANNGSYVKEGDGVELAAMVDAGELLLAANLDEVTAAKVLEQIGPRDAHTPEVLAWGEKVLAELRALQTLEQHAAVHAARASGAKARNARLQSAAKDRVTGMQGCDAAFETAQGETLAVVEIVFQSIFGERQSRFASWLLEAEQFRARSFTSGTFISRGVRPGDANGAVGQSCGGGDGDGPDAPDGPDGPDASDGCDDGIAGDAVRAPAASGSASRRSTRHPRPSSRTRPRRCARPKRRQRRINPQQALLDDLDERLQRGATIQQLGFGSEEQVDLFRLSKRRLMDPHPDRSDYRSAYFLDGLAATVSRSAGAMCGGENGSGEGGSAGGSVCGGNDGSNAVLGRTTADGGARGKAPIDFMRAVSAGSEAERAHTIVKIPAAVDGTLSFFRARSQLHGATTSAWRDVAIFYKNGETVRLQQAVFAGLPTLRSVRPEHRALACALLERSVLRTRETQIPALRTAGLWKALSSKHSGENRYESKHDLAILGVDGVAELRDRALRRIAATFGDSGGGGAAAASSSGSGGGRGSSSASTAAPKPMELMAALAVELVCDVGPETILRPVARRLVAAPELEVERSDFDECISDHVWHMRLGHALTLMDAKASRTHTRVKHIQSVCEDEDEVLARVLALEHTAYITASYHRKLIIEDSTEAMADGPLAATWANGDALAMCKVVCDVGAESAQRQEAKQPSLATCRHSISGLPWVSKPRTASSKKGAGEGRSLAGYADGSRPDLSLVQAILENSKLLHKAATQRQNGAHALLAALSKLPGGGGLCSKRTVTYLEGTGLIGGVLEPYVTGGAGSRNALKFLAAVLGIEWCDVDEAAFMRPFKAMLEFVDANGRRPLEAAVYERASAVPALSGLEDMCAELASGLFTGGSLETLLCDVIWRCWRPIKLEAHKPRLPRWNAEASGGELLCAYAIFRMVGEAATVVDVDAFIAAWCKAKSAGGALPTSHWVSLHGGVV